MDLARSIGTTSRRTAWLAAELAALVAFVAARGFAFFAATGIDVPPDGATYIDTASQSIMRAPFWTGPHPPGTAALLKVAGRDLERFTVAQLVISVVCWSGLALVIRRSTRTAAVGVVSLAWVLFFACTTPVIVWDRIVLSESLSISLLAALFALGIACACRCTALRCSALVVIAAVWGFTRDSNAWVLAIAGVLLMLGRGAFTANRRLATIVGSAFLGIFLTAATLSAAPRLLHADIGASSDPAAPPDVKLNGRWVFPFLNVLMHRLLVRPEAVAFFTAHGMPVTDELRQHIGGWASPDLYDSPSLAGFRRWVSTTGRAAYLRYLASRPFETFVESTSAIQPMISSPLRVRASEGFQPLISGPFAELLFPRTWSLLSWLALVSLAFVSGASQWRADRRWLVAALAVLLVYPHAAILWFGDAMEVERHAAELNVQLRIGMILAAILALDDRLGSASGESGRR